MMFFNRNASLSTSNVCLVISPIFFQCLAFIALCAIISNSGQLSLKSSICCLRSWYACQSFKPFGSFRHLKKRTGETFSHNKKVYSENFHVCVPYAILKLVSNFLSPS